MVEQNLSLDSSLGKIKSKFSAMKFGQLVVDNNQSRLNADGKYVFTATLKDNPEFKIIACCRNYANAKDKLIKKLSAFLSKHKNKPYEYKYKKWQPKKEKKRN